MSAIKLLEELNIVGNLDLLEELLLHSSIVNASKEIYGSELKRKNELYTMSGKTMLDLLCSLHFILNMTIESVHDLTEQSYSFKASFCEKFYSHFNIEKYISFSTGEMASRNKLIYPEMVYKIVWFIYEQNGFDKINFIFEKVSSMIDNFDRYDYKSQLFEYANSLKKNIIYEIIAEEGTEHNKIVTTKVAIEDKFAVGSALGKKQSSKHVAKLFFEKYNIPIKSRQNKKMSLIRMNKNWFVDDKRKSEISQIYKLLKIDETILPIHYIDASLTHKSMNTVMNKSFIYDDNSFLSILGSIVTEMVINEYLNDIYSKNDEELNIIGIRASIESNSNLSKFIDINLIKTIRYIRDEKTDNTSIYVDAFKSLLGSIFLFSIREKRKNPLIYIKSIINNICEHTLENPDINYTAIIQEITVNADLNVSDEKIISIGKDNEKLYYCELKLSDAKGRIQTIYKIGEGKSKKSARNAASKELLHHIEKMLLLNKFRNDSTNISYFDKSTSIYIRNALKSVLNENQSDKSQVFDNVDIENDSRKEIIDKKNEQIVEKGLEKSTEIIKRKKESVNPAIIESNSTSEILNEYGTFKPEKKERIVTSTKRNLTVVKKLKELYKHQCQICGISIKISDIQYVSHVHHIQPLGMHFGADKSENMIVLCPNHHAMFDNGVITIDIINKKVIHIDRTNDLNRNPLIIKHKINYKYVEYHNKNILLAEINLIDSYCTSKPVLEYDFENIVDYGDEVKITDCDTLEIYDIKLEKHCNRVFMTPIQNRILRLKIDDVFSFENYTYRIVNILKSI